jgi:hypothetical protein
MWSRVSVDRVTSVDAKKMGHFSINSDEIIDFNLFSDSNQF